jgi:hypothetical protein
MRLDGNSFLVIDGDSTYVQDLMTSIQNIGGNCSGALFLEDAKTFLKTSDVDVVICSYYLPDGIIHQLIDWCKINLDSLPTFTTIEYPLQGEKDFLHRQLVAEVFFKKQSHDEILKLISMLIFDFKEFKNSILDIAEPRGISLELFSNKNKHWVKAIEITSDSLFISADESFDFGSFGLLMVTVFDQGDYENFHVVGFFEGHFPGGQYFKVHNDYGQIWSRLLVKLEDKQLSIDKFLQKASGK